MDRTAPKPAGEAWSVSSTSTDDVWVVAYKKPVAHWDGARWTIQK